MTKILEKKSIIYIVTIIFFFLLLFAWIFKGHIIRMVAWPFLPKMDPPEIGVLRFAAIGDYGSGNLWEGDVAKLVKSWNPKFIITLGDNNHPNGARETIDQNIGQFYHEYIFPYKGRFGKGASKNRFFPIPGHRDWDSEWLKPYLDYFELPGQERYYDFTEGPVHFFMLDTDEREPDGSNQNSIQAKWLKNEMLKSKSIWKIICAHHAPYTSHMIENFERMRWPFKNWGADVVLSGYYHIYDRLNIDGLTYIINGSGGSFISTYNDSTPKSNVFYNEDFGALLFETNKEFLSFKFINRMGTIIDSYKINK